MCLELDIHMGLVVHLVVHHLGGLMTTLTATAARKGFFEILKKANKHHEIFHIHHHSGDAVLLSEQEYDSLNESLALLSTPGFRDAFNASRKQAENHETVSFEDVFGEAQ